MKKIIVILLLLVSHNLIAQEVQNTNCNHNIFIKIKKLFLFDTRKASQYNSEGIKLYADNKIKESIVKYNKALVLVNEDKCLKITGYLYANLAVAYDDLEQYKIAIFYYKKSIEVKKIVFPSNKGDLAKSYKGLAGSYRAIAAYKKAEENYKLAVDTLKTSMNKNMSLLGQIYTDMGENYRLSDDLNKSFIFNKRAIGILEKSQNNLLILAIAYNNLGLSYDDDDNATQAIKYYLRSIELKDKDSYELATTYNNIAAAYNTLDKFDQAINYYRKAKVVLEKYVQGNSFVLFAIDNNMGVCYEDQGKLDDALESLKKAYEGGVGVLGESHPHIKTFKENLERVSKKLQK